MNKNDMLNNIMFSQKTDENGVKLVDVLRGRQSWINDYSGITNDCYIHDLREKYPRVLMFFGFSPIVPYLIFYYAARLEITNFQIRIYVNEKQYEDLKTYYDEDHIYTTMSSIKRGDCEFPMIEILREGIKNTLFDSSFSIMVFNVDSYSDMSTKYSNDMITGTLRNAQIMLGMQDGRETDSVRKHPNVKYMYPHKLGLYGGDTLKDDNSTSDRHSKIFAPSSIYPFISFCESSVHHSTDMEISGCFMFDTSVFTKVYDFFLNYICLNSHIEHGLRIDMRQIYNMYYFSECEGTFNLHCISSRISWYCVVGEKVPFSKYSIIPYVDDITEFKEFGFFDSMKKLIFSSLVFGIHNCTPAWCLKKVIRCSDNFGTYGNIFLHEPIYIPDSDDYFGSISRMQNTFTF